MRRKSWLITYGLSVIATLLGLVIVAHAQFSLQPCRYRFGDNPVASCPSGCWCDTNASPQRGYCCGTLTLHGETYCCIYSNARNLYPCKLQGGSRCGYALCGPCGDVTSREMGSCQTINYNDPSWATCMTTSVGE